MTLDLPNGCLDRIPKDTSNRRKTDTGDLIKMKNLCTGRGITEQKDSPQNGRKYVQSIYAEYKYIPRLSNKITITK